ARRRADVRLSDRHSRRDVGGCDDGGLGSAAVRPARDDLVADHQRDPRREPRRLGFELEAACDDRVGVAPPPYRIETERTALRCYAPNDAPLLKDAIDSGLDRRRPWMPWARHEPQPLEQKVELMRMFRGSFDLGTDFVYGIFEPGESRQLGGAGLHPRGGGG